MQLNISEEEVLASSFVDSRLMANRNVWIKMIYLLDDKWTRFLLNVIGQISQEFTDGFQTVVLELTILVSY